MTYNQIQGEKVVIFERKFIKISSISLKFDFVEPRDPHLLRVGKIIQPHGSYFSIHIAYLVSFRATKRPKKKVHSSMARRPKSNQNWPCKKVQKSRFLKLCFVRCHTLSPHASNLSPLTIIDNF